MSHISLRLFEGNLGSSTCLPEGNWVCMKLKTALWSAYSQWVTLFADWNVGIRENYISDGHSGVW